MRKRNFCKVFKSYNKMRKLKKKIKSIREPLRKNRQDSREQHEAGRRRATVSWVQTSVLRLTPILIRDKWWTLSVKNAHNKEKASSVSLINFTSNATTAASLSLSEKMKNCTKIAHFATLTSALFIFLLAKRMGQSSFFLVTGAQLARSLHFFLKRTRLRCTLSRTY